MTVFDHLPHVRFGGPDATDPLALRYYEKDRAVLGRRMEDWLRPSVAYWHSFVANGLDPFGAPTQDRPWFHGEPLQAAMLKADAAFAFMERLGLPFFCFHDRDVAPEGDRPRQSNAMLDQVLERIEGHMQRTGIRLLWGTANLFGWELMFSSSLVKSAARPPDAAPADPVAPRFWSPRTSSSGAARLRQSLRHH